MITLYNVVNQCFIACAHAVVLELLVNTDTTSAQSLQQSRLRFSYVEGYDGGTSVSVCRISTVDK